MGWHWLIDFQVSGVLFYNTSSVYCIVCSPPQVKSPSITIYHFFSFFYLLPYPLNSRSYAWILLPQPENIAFGLVLLIKIKIFHAHIVFIINQDRFIFNCNWSMYCSEVIIFSRTEKKKIIVNIIEHCWLWTYHTKSFAYIISFKGIAMICFIWNHFPGTRILNQHPPRFPKALHLCSTLSFSEYFHIFNLLQIYLVDKMLGEIAWDNQIRSSRVKIGAGFYSYL